MSSSQRGRSSSGSAGLTTVDGINRSLTVDPRTPDLTLSWPSTSGHLEAGNLGPAVTAVAEVDDASSNHIKRSRQTSWSSAAESSEPIDIPHSPRDDSMFGEFQTMLTGGESSDDNGQGPVGGVGQNGGGWSASWYRSEPWQRDAELLGLISPEKPPAHIMIWEERASRGASQAAMEAARGRGASDVGSDATADEDMLSTRGDTSSEDSIFEMDM